MGDQEVEWVRVRMGALTPTIEPFAFPAHGMLLAALRLNSRAWRGDVARCLPQRDVLLGDCELLLPYLDGAGYSYRFPGIPESLPRQERHPPA